MKSELQQLCIELYKKGTEPTTGLLRAKSPRNVSLPDAIATIRWWQQQDKTSLLDSSSLTPAVTENTESNGPKSKAEILAKIASIETQLNELKAMVAHYPEESN